MKSMQISSVVKQQVLTGCSVLSLLLMVGCYGWNSGCKDCHGFEEPLYMSYSELRQPVQQEAPRELSHISRLYLYHDLILLNSHNQGIHVYDNADPLNPQRIAFINIPGNTELSILDNYLYADSYVDLVVLDISDVNNIHEVNRQPGVFPYDAYQSIDDNGVYFGAIDETRGVVVGYR